MDKNRREAENILANLRRMIAEAKRMNAESQDRAKGTRMLAEIVNHETKRSRDQHAAYNKTDEDEMDEDDAA